MRRRVVFCLVLMAVLFGFANFRLFLRPAVGSPPDRADAVVVLAGGQGDRFRRALELMDAHVSPVLVLSIASSSPALPPVCSRPYPGFTLVCARPEPGTTQGEARMVARLATERGWQRVAIVTSPYHVTRARLLVGRCYPGELTMVSSRPRRSISALLGNLEHEWIGTLYALAVRRSC